jgi:diacylglycerol kinase (ATP)
MKHIFILNPAAGKGKIEKTLFPRIINDSKRLDIDYEIHRTFGPGDAEQFIKRRCTGRNADTNYRFNTDKEGDKLRFYACGGDGTLNEVINGAFGQQNVEVAMIPAGTGNDFPRNFGSLDDFNDIEGQILGQPRPIDLIRYQQIAEDGKTELLPRYGVNMFNIGLDSNAADLAARLKTYPFIPISLAYILGLVAVLGKKEGVNLEICLDDGEIYKGDFMLIAIGNGAYCGGGYKGVPYASVDDGLIDVSIVKEISRFKLVTLLNKYKEGTHLEDPSTADFIEYRKCKRLIISSKNAVKLSVDGEISMIGKITFEMIPSCINFSVPRTCGLI